MASLVEMQLAMMRAEDACLSKSLVQTPRPKSPHKGLWDRYKDWSGINDVRFRREGLRSARSRYAEDRASAKAASEKGRVASRSWRDRSGAVHVQPIDGAYLRDMDEAIANGREDLGRAVLRRNVRVGGTVAVPTAGGAYALSRGREDRRS